MRRIFIYCFLFCSSIGLAKQNAKFYLEFADLNFVPSVTKNNDGTLTLITDNSQINAIYRKYVIYSFERIAPKALSINLQKTYAIECSNIQLMDDLHNNFPNIYVMVEKIDKPIDGGILYTPNDYTLLESSLGSDYEQNYLDAINAEEAWDITHGSPDVLIGIADTGFQLAHEELANKNATLLGSNTGYPSNWHGTDVTGLAAGETNNNKGISSIGFDSGLIVKVGTGYVPYFTSLVENGAKVLNGSWYTTITTNGGTPNITDQNLINDYTDQNVVVVIAAGNGPGSGWPPSVVNAENYSNRYYYPASYQNVISVSTVGDKNIPNTTTIPFDNWLNIHKIHTPPNSHYSGTGTPGIPILESEIFHQHNDSVDIVVPAYRLPIIGAWTNSDYWAIDENGLSGTSFSAPIVCGTVGLMFAVNYCLKPKEVESILKLTAVNIEDLPENLEFHGRLGGGALDAFKAVEMANEMAKPFGTVNVTDRILYRNWFYKLETAPFEIKMEDNLITDGAKVKFFARDNIEVLSGDYLPDIGYVDLQINSSLSLDCEIPSSKMTNEINSNKEILNSNNVTLYPNPNEGIFTILVSGIDVKNLNIEIFDIFGKSVFKTISNSITTEINTRNLPVGVYLVRTSSNEVNEILKFIKK